LAQRATTLRFDAGRFDAGRFDAGRFDAGRFDAGRFDAGSGASGDRHMARDAAITCHAHVSVLLSTYNGARFLREHLASLLDQEHGGWTLYWRDDGSQDDTLAIMGEFAGRLAPRRCVHVENPSRHLGATASFLALLEAVTPTLGEADVVAFADQDDIWLPRKLGMGVATLAREAPDTPALYCARQFLVDAGLRPLGLSDLLARSTEFPAALAQNVATGCTVMMNRRAAALVAASHPGPVMLHDWWCYLLVTAAGGRVLHETEPVVLYRQHGGNLVGAPPSMLRRAAAACRRGPGAFMAVLRQHIAALQAHRHLLSPTAQGEVALIDRALRGGPLARLRAAFLPGLHRQSWLQTAVFRAWFLFG
jgi:Glycosyl transferase family 2